MKGKRLLATVLACMLALSGCSSSTSETTTTASADAIFTAGTYTGTGAGRNGDVKVEVVFTDTEIESVTVTEHEETAGVSDPAIEEMPGKIVDAQSTKVDTVTGATLTSNAIIEAVNDAITQAGADPEALGSAEETGTTEKTEETYDVDVLVVGGGMAGLTAALAAKQAGANVILAEKGATLGGTVNVAGGILIACDSEYFSSYEDAPDSLEDMRSTWEKHMAYSGQDSGYPDYDRWEYVVSQTGETIDWLVENGAEFLEEPSTLFDGGTYAMAYDVDGGAGLVKQLTAALDSQEVEYQLNTTVTELVTDEDGNVVGAKAETDDANITYTAKTVILCTGGYANNEELLEKYAPELAAVNIVSGAAATSTGDGFYMAEAVGADIFTEGFGALWGTQVEPEALAAAPDLANLTFATTLGVNGKGERFASESPSEPFMDATCSDMIQDGNAPFTYIFDSSDEESAAILAAAAEAGAIKSADTIEELAEATGIENLQEAYDAYMALVEAGEDTQYGKSSEYLVALETGPFYAVEYVPTTFGSTGGVKTDYTQHVLDTDGNVIGGLYAAGEMSNRYFYNENYILAASLGLYSTCGRIAGTTAAEEALAD